MKVMFKTFEEMAIVNPRIKELDPNFLEDIKKLFIKNNGALDVIEEDSDAYLLAVKEDGAINTRWFYKHFVVNALERKIDLLLEDEK